MNWKAFVFCALLLASLHAVRAADPISYREIAMLLRNGEDQQFIIKDTARRKLLQPLSEEEADTLLSLHATPALMNLLRDPATVVSPQAAAAYASRLEQQKLQALREQQFDEQAAANARLQQQQQQAQLLAKAGGAGGASAGANGDVIGKAIGLTFIAADGTPFDLEKLRGRVVLIDFWATWCGPCMREVPNVVAAYAKYHGKGFEVVGISLDKNKDNMLKVAAEKGMTWPQYFDGKGWNNDISSKAGIRQIPTMWLVNKNGLVATTEARDNLDADIAQLLAE